MSLIVFRVAAGIVAFLALGFGIPAVIGAAHLARTGSVWRLWGFPTYGPGLFPRWGIPFSAVLLVVFAATCALALAAAVLLVLPGTAAVGAIAGLVLIVAQAVFWIGFQLPVGPPLGLVAAALLVIGLVARSTTPGG